MIAVKLLMILAALAAGAGAMLITRPRTGAQEGMNTQRGTTYELGQDEAVIDGAEDGNTECRAHVEESCRAMDFMTLQGASRVTFRTEDGLKLKFYIPGESGVHLLKGDEGMLEYRQQTFLSFTKDSGEIVGALYHIPAEDAEA